jgi:anti-sigma regulatory factor (Ser/Thr protein kinase)
MMALEFVVAPQATGSITVPATLDHLDDAYDLLHAELADRYCPIGVQHQIDIALEEIFVNVCSYAYEDADKPGEVRVEYVYYADPNSLTVSITDWGVPFDPLAHDDPKAPASAAEASIGGLGILMVKRMCDDVSYLRDGDANVVAIRKVW